MYRFEITEARVYLGRRKGQNAQKKFSPYFTMLELSGNVQKQHIGLGHTNAHAQE